MCKILIADDEENILRGMERYIREHTHCFDQIYCVGNGVAALDVILCHRPDVMLLDVQMPGKSGLEVMRDAQRTGLCPKTIILSGYDTFAYAQQALRMGAADYLLKPCRSSELLEKLERLATGTGAVESTAAPGNDLISAATRYCQEHLEQDLTLQNVAQVIEISPSYLSTLFSHEMGGFVNYLNKIRIDCARDYFYDPSLKVYEIAYKVGFHDEKYFSRVFKKITGQSPSEYQHSLEKQNTPKSAQTRLSGNE